MSAVDELTKLNELKDKGVITLEQFEKQKAIILGSSTKRSYWTMSGKPFNKKSLWWKIPFGTLAFVWLTISIFKEPIDTLPTCDSSEATKTLMEAFTQSQYARTLNLSAIEVTQMHEVTYDKTSKKRVCDAIITTNTVEKVAGTYTLEGRPKGEFMLTFQAKDEKSPAVDAGQKAQDAAVVPTQATPQPQATAPEVAATATDAADEQEDPVVEACVQATRDKYREDIGPDGIITAGDIDGWTEQCKAEKKAK